MTPSAPTINSAGALESDVAGAPAAAVARRGPLRFGLAAAALAPEAETAGASGVESAGESGLVTTVDHLMLASPPGTERPSAGKVARQCVHTHTHCVQRHARKLGSLYTYNIINREAGVQ